MTLEKWLEKNPPLKKKSNLYEYKEEIVRLLGLNYTQNQIVAYLKDIHKVETTQQNVSSFLKREQKTINTAVKSNVKNTQITMSEEDEEAKRKAELDKYVRKFTTA